SVTSSDVLSVFRSEAPSANLPRSHRQRRVGPVTSFIASEFAGGDNRGKSESSCLLARPSSLAVNDQWYYRENGEARGPLSRQQLEQLAHIGEIGNASMV